VTFTLQTEPDQVPGSSAGNSEEEMAQRLQLDLGRLKNFIESRSTQTASSQQASSSDPVAGAPEAHRTTQSDYSLSQPADDEGADGRFSIAEEVNFDQQSADARRVGQMPQDISAVAPTATDPSEGMAQSMKQEAQDAKDGTDLKQSIERAVPPSI
jgi:hypothetical protein